MHEELFGITEADIESITADWLYPDAPANDLQLEQCSLVPGSIVVNPELKTLRFSLGTVRPHPLDADDYVILLRDGELFFRCDHDQEHAHVERRLSCFRGDDGWVLRFAGRIEEGTTDIYFRISTA